MTRFVMATIGTLALVTATARCGSAQEQTQEKPDARPGPEPAPFVVRGGGFGGGSYLGVYIADVDAEDVERLKLDRERGVLIEDVSEDGPAARAGLVEGDVITAWNDTPVESAAQLQRLVRETPSGREIDLDVMRDGRRRDVTVEIGERESLVRQFSFRGPDPERVGEMRERLRLHAPEIGARVLTIMGGGRLGVGIQTLGEQLGAYFGLGDRTGVLVTSVSEDSPAEEAGLRAGDVILSVDGESIEGTGDLARRIREADEGPTRISILRDREERTLTVELPEQPAFEWKDGPAGAILTVPEHVEGALQVVPEMLEGLRHLPEIRLDDRSDYDDGVKVDARARGTVRT